MVIPYTLWQSHKTKEIPEQSKQLVDSWLKYNPGLKWNYMDDKDCLEFFISNFDTEYVEMYQKLPIPVMKADLWRVAVLYINGGIYADMDTECLRPIESWIDKDDELVVGVETEIGDVGNFCFAATPKHPVLLKVLKELLRVFKEQTFHLNTTTPVQNYGQLHFAKVIKESLCEYNIKVLPKGIIGENSPNCAVYHHTASLFWTNYNSWRHNQTRIFGIFEENDEMYHLKTKVFKKKLNNEK